jgi:hypothetical protein
MSTSRSSRWARKRIHRDDPRQIELFPVCELVRTVDVHGARVYKVVADAPVAWVRPAQLASAIGVSVRTVYGWIAAGIIGPDEYVRRGPKLLFIRAAAAHRMADTKAIREEVRYNRRGICDGLALEGGE